MIWTEGIPDVFSTETDCGTWQASVVKMENHSIALIYDLRERLPGVILREIFSDFETAKTEMEKKLLDLLLQKQRDKRRGEKAMYSTVIRCYNHLGELICSKIVDSSTRSGATRRANGWLAETSFTPIKKTNVDNYQYWNCKVRT